MNKLMFNSEDNTHTHSFVKYIYKVFKSDFTLLLYEARIVRLQTLCEKGRDWLENTFVLNVENTVWSFLNPANLWIMTVGSKDWIDLGLD